MTNTLSWTTDHYDQLCKKFADSEQECLALELKLKQVTSECLELQSKSERKDAEIANLQNLLKQKNRK